MKTLNIGDSYKHQQSIFTVIRRQDNIVMAHDGNNIWEVFRIRIRKEKELPSGSTLEPGEYPPSTAEFGDFARCHTFEDLAERSFMEFVKMSQKPCNPLTNEPLSYKNRGIAPLSNEVQKIAIGNT